MSRRTIVETGRDRRALAADAGFGPVSFVSILAGVLVAYGAFAIIAALAAAIIDALGIDADVVSTDYEQASIVGGLITAAVLFVSYLYGGYVAGRMARRRGVVQGILVSVLGLIIVAVVAALVNLAEGTDDIVGNLRDLGVPTTADAYGQAFTVAGLAALAAIIVGGLLGGILGERWHGRLLARAVDPNVGTEAEMRSRAQQDMARAEEQRTRSFERARATSPERARRVDREALSDDDRRLVEGDTVAGQTDGPTVVDRSRSDADERDRPSAWRVGAAGDRRRSDAGDEVTTERGRMGAADATAERRIDATAERRIEGDEVTTDRRRSETADQAPTERRSEDDRSGADTDAGYSYWRRS